MSVTKAEQDEPAAYHEAGHAVIAIVMGWFVNHEGIRIEPDYYTGLRCTNQVAFIDGTGPINVAGWLSEWKFHQRGEQLKSDENLKDLIWEYTKFGEFENKFEGEPLDDVEDTIKHMLDLNFNDTQVLQFFRLYEQRVIRLLDNPSVWGAIRLLVTQLLERRALPGDFANSLIRDALGPDFSEY